MNSRIFLSLTTAALVSAFSMPALAQAQTRIGDLQQRSQGTTLSGQVVRSVGNNFVLNDGTGEVIVDAGPRWWREINLSNGERITVTGDLGRGGEFAAYSITRANGSVIEIRSPEGPPPWAGGPNRARPQK